MAKRKKTASDGCEPYAESSLMTGPIGIDRTGRVAPEAGQEGAMAVHEHRSHAAGRMVDADKGPDYSGCIDKA